MSTWDAPRIHFAGRFQADTSTINNDVRHYKSDAFRPEFQAPMVGYGQGVSSDEDQRTNGYWNPEGSGAWRMVGCTVTGAVGTSGPVTDDPALQLRMAGSDSRVAGKLVDLDPQQQLVSQIWGLEIRLVDAMGQTRLSGRYRVSPFIDLWKRQQIAQNFDQTLAAVYQSQLHDVTWGRIDDSPILQALKAATQHGRLAIRMNVFGFDRDPNAPDFSTGAVNGTIGPVSAGEPVTFTLGRQFVPVFLPPFPVVPVHGVNTCTAVVHSDRKVVTIDLGNALPIVTAAGDPMPMGSLALGVARDPSVEGGAVLAADAVLVLGPLPYEDGFTTNAGVLDLPYGDDAAALLPDHPLVLLEDLGTSGYRVRIRETAEGISVRAEPFVHRMNPGESSPFTVWATRYGAPTATTVTLGFVPAARQTIGGAGTGANLNAATWPIPKVAYPETALTFPATVEVGASGHARARLQASAEGPGNPRGYLDGQVYAVELGLVDPPKTWRNSPWHFVSVLTWDALDVPETPTWHRDIQPIFTQYGNLYPIMSHWIDLADYEQVVANTRILTLAFGLPLEDPNHMPVSRDLSAAKRAMIQKWLTTPGADGKPLRGDPGDTPAPRPPKFTRTVPPARRSDAPDGAGKLDFLVQAVAARQGGD